MADVALGGLDAAGSAAANVGSHSGAADHLGIPDDDGDIFHDAVQDPQDLQQPDIGLTSSTGQQAAAPGTLAGTPGQAGDNVASGSATAGGSDGAGQIAPTAHQPAAAGGAGTAPVTRTNDQIARYQAVADWYENALRPTADQQPAQATGLWSRLTAGRQNRPDQQTRPDGDRQAAHPSLALRQGNLTDAIQEMRGAINDDGTVSNANVYTAARDRADTNAAELVNTQTSENTASHNRRQEDATLRVASRTTAGIWAGSAIAGVSTIGAAVTGGLVAWNNVRQGHHLSNDGGNTTNKTNNDTNGTGTPT